MIKYEDHLSNISILFWLRLLELEKKNKSTNNYSELFFIQCDNTFIKLEVKIFLKDFSTGYFVDDKQNMYVDY